MKIAIAGTGYVGLVTGVCLAEKGNAVICVDINEAKIQKLKAGMSPIYEPGLPELMKKNDGSLSYTTDYRSAYAASDVIFIGVETPEKPDGSADLKYVHVVAEQIATSITQDCVIVVKSTVPVGTNQIVEEKISSMIPENIKISVVSNPEFLAQGTAIRDTLQASRIVIGSEEDWAIDRLLHVYRNFDVPKLVMHRVSAEMVKYASNDFLALKLSYINEIANFCETVNADIDEVVLGMGYDPRIGNRFLQAGIGYGGSCFPKDTKALSWLASHNHSEIKTIKAAIEINDAQKLKLLEKSHRHYPCFAGLKIAVLGLTFKPGTDDLREAPSLVNIPVLLEEGAMVYAWDPVGTKNYKKLYPDQIHYTESIEDAIQDADLCLIFTEWEEIRQLDPSVFVRKMRKPVVVDGRNCYSLDAVAAAGLYYESIGRPSIYPMRDASL